MLGNVLTKKLGVKAGDRIGTFAWNNYQHVEFYFGIPGAGGSLPYFEHSPFPEQLAWIVNHAEDKVIFIDGTLLPLFQHFTNDGWFRTGDVATIDPNGYMNITDRTKDLVKSGGEWISTVELENIIMSHPQVLEAAVIAIPDEKWSERPMAMIAPTSDGDLTEDALRIFLEAQIAKFWMPYKFVFIDEIPKTSVGKFNKKVLRQQYSEGDLF
jgi:acyl-CoA synthetase (AMP-forming)/AMP-acid ligase II